MGIVVASAGRSTPAIMPNAAWAAITVAPVCPALNERRRAFAATSSATRTPMNAAYAAGRRRRFAHLDDIGRIDDLDAGDRQSRARSRPARSAVRPDEATRHRGAAQRHRAVDDDRGA